MYKLRFSYTLYVLENAREHCTSAHTVLKLSKLEYELSQTIYPLLIVNHNFHKESIGACTSIS